MSLRIPILCFLLPLAIAAPQMGCVTTSPAPTDQMEHRMAAAIVRLNCAQPPILADRRQFDMERWDGERRGDYFIPSKTVFREGRPLVLVCESAPDFAYEQEAANARLMNLEISPK